MIKANESTNNTPEHKSQKDQIKELTDRLEAGVQAVFESDNYTEDLKCMSKVHRYSVNNSLLIAMQRPGATLVASYRNWEQRHGRHVRKGEKGIKIFAPCIYNVELDEKDENGNAKTVKRTGFRVTTVFDVSQTEGPELPSFGVDELTGDVRDYGKVFDALVRISPVPVRFEDVPGNAKGYFSDAEKVIVLNTGMSQAQTIKTLLHEVSHATYHSRNTGDFALLPDRNHRETEAESIAFVVGSALKIIDSSDYSFPYLASWASDKDTKELKNSLERIRSAADEMITEINRELLKEQQRGAETPARMDHWER